MRVTIIYNPSSGRGRAARIAARFERALREAGHDLVMRRIGGAGNGDPELLLLIGGDGTVKHALDEAIARHIPVYHVPLGNENLFAREFDMTRDPRRLLEAMHAGCTIEMDVGAVQGQRILRPPRPVAALGDGERVGERGTNNRDSRRSECNPPSPPTRPSNHGGRPPIMRFPSGVGQEMLPCQPSSERPSDRFAIMLSIGPDASVIHRMERWGREVGGHLAYLAPVAEELAEPRIVPITAEVDRRRIVNAQPGLVVVANLRRYGFGVNPARDADPCDGLLDLVFIPATTPGPLFRAGAWGRLGRLDSMPGVVMARGSEVRLEAPGGLAQVDGEALHMQTPMRLRVEPRALRVLVPPHGRV